MHTLIVKIEYDGADSWLTPGHVQEELQVNHTVKLKVTELLSEEAEVSGATRYMGIQVDHILRRIPRDNRTAAGVAAVMEALKRSWVT